MSLQDRTDTRYGLICLLVLIVLVLGAAVALWL